MKVVWSPLALDRVGQIADFIALDSHVAARKWVETIFAKVKRLAKFPESGRAVPEMKRLEIRELIFGEYSIVYRIDRNRIAILTVRHGRQKLLTRELI